MHTVACTCMHACTNLYIYVIVYYMYRHGNFMHYFKHVSYNNIHENTKFMEISEFFFMNLA